MAAKQIPQSRLAASPVYPPPKAKTTSAKAGVLVGLWEKASTRCIRRPPKIGTGHVGPPSKDDRIREERPKAIVDTKTKHVGDYGTKTKPAVIKKDVLDSRVKTKCVSDKTTCDLGKAPSGKELKSAVVIASATTLGQKVIKAAPATKKASTKSDDPATTTCKKTVAKREKPASPESMKPVAKSDAPKEITLKTPVEKYDKPADTSSKKPAAQSVKPGTSSASASGMNAVEKEPGSSADSADAMPSDYKAPQIKVNPIDLPISKLETEKPIVGRSKFKEAPLKQNRLDAWFRGGEGRRAAATGGHKKKRKPNSAPSLTSNRDRMARMSSKPKPRRSTARYIIISALVIICVILVTLLVVAIYFAAT